MLKSEDELFSDEDKSENEIDYLPTKFTEWVDKNSNRIKTAKSIPFFFSDNEGMLNGEFLDRAILNTRKKAQSSSKELWELAEKIANRNKGIAVPINLKSTESIKRKVLLERKKNPTFSPDMLKDNVRTTIITDYENIKNIIADLRADDKFFRLKEQKTELGYRGWIVNVRTKNGMIAEIQINNPKMIYAKERPEDAKKFIGENLWNKINSETGLDGGLGHKFYEEWRILNPDSKEAEEIAQKSREYYKHFTY